MEELILTKAKDLFFSHGLRTISMDDIAKAAGMSKKTIYQCFAHKNEILDGVLKNFLHCYKHVLLECKHNAKDSVNEVIESARLSIQHISQINRNFFYDLEKFFPEGWLLLRAYRQQVLIPSIIANIQKGIDEEHYRNDLDIPFVADVRVQQISTAFNPKSFNGKIQSANKLMWQLSEFYLHGIATARGKRLIHKYLNVNNETQLSN